VYFHFCIFTGVLPDYYLLNSASTQNLRESLSNFNIIKEKNVYSKQKIQVFSINTQFIFILWHKNYHISLVATATHEIFIFIPLNENKSCIYRKKLNILYLILPMKYGAVSVKYISFFFTRTVSRG
jgi:hypothetical protein